MPQILVVDDEPIMLETVERFLKLHGFQTVGATRALEALDIARQQPQFAAYVVDYRMPDQDGIALSRALRAEGDQSPIILLTADEDPVLEAEAFGAGIDDVAYKSRPLAILLARLKARLNGGHAVTGVSLDRARNEARIDGYVVTLTPIECKLMVALSRANESVSFEFLLSELWGRNGKRGTLDVHLTNLRAKLRPAGFVLRTTRGAGVQLERANGKPDGV